MAKKGLSNDEKRAKLLEFFTREHNFYNIKEVESLGSKFVGTHPMQMKELLQQLIDDDLVRSEKCGVTTVYWCFEYDKLKKMKEVVTMNQEKLDKLEAKKLMLQKNIETESGARKNSSYLKLKYEVSKLEARKAELFKLIEASSFNMDNMSSIKATLSQKLNDAECFTDNIEVLVSYFQKEYGIERSYFKQELDIPEEFKDLPSIDDVFL